MLKVGLVGLGFMGRGHFSIYEQLMKEGFPVQLIALCDVDEDKFKGILVKGNIDVGADQFDFTPYRQYSNLEDMLAHEELDMVDLAVPTYLHAKLAIQCMLADKHVLCEKPMAMDKDQCKAMPEARKQTGKKLMIAQCLRFWPAYEYLKTVVDDGRFGCPVEGYFWRGGGAPRWSYEGWLLNEELSGGCILDQHIHDVDTINWLFGKPHAVSALGRNVIPGAGFDVVSTHYYYKEGPMICAQDDWTLEGGFPFDMRFRVAFERGNLLLEGGKLRVFQNDGPEIDPELPEDNGYIREIKYFINCIINDQPIKTCTPKSTMATIRIASAERESARKNGRRVKV